MFDWLATLTAGKRVQYAGEEYILVSSTALRANETIPLYLAVKSQTNFPAQVFLIPVENEDDNK